MKMPRVIAAILPATAAPTTISVIERFRSEGEKAAAALYEINQAKLNEAAELRAAAAALLTDGAKREVESTEAGNAYESVNAFLRGAA